ncbi:hypothetical protein [Providencia rettgeri]|uniref:hypothetical protein n=1 Tax=Providencia rettgeri TaxID=587 RepID=UPI0035239749
MIYQLDNLDLRTKIAIFRGITALTEKLENAPELVREVMPMEANAVEYNTRLDEYYYYTQGIGYTFKITFDDFGELNEFSITKTN